MNAPLAGLRIVEVSAFVAAPLSGMTMAQLGAEVIRIDPIGGNIDYNRWPLAPNGKSIYWASLNKAKKSVEIALDTPEGRELARSIMCAPGKGGGIVLTNLPPRGWMSYEELSKHRSDLILMRLTGNFDGSAAVDYTVNCSGGFPMITGQGGQPVNHVLPAWDVAAGLYLSIGLLSAERVRSHEGRGQEITLALSDVMLATIGNLGFIGDVQVNGTLREAIGNDLYGAFGRNFTTADHREIMIVVISNRQWNALKKATGLADRLDMVGPLMNVDLGTEGGRFHARHAIAAVLEPWCVARPLAEIKQLFDGSGVLWGIYQNFHQLVEDDSRCSTVNPMFGEIDQPGLGRVLTPRVPLSFSEDHAPLAKAAPQLGQDTAAVLENLLGLSPDDIYRLRTKGILGNPSC